MNLDIQLCIDFGTSRKLIIVEPGLDFEGFKKYLREEFKVIQNRIKLIDVRRNAEVISMKSLKDENELVIEVESEVEPLPEEQKAEPENVPRNNSYEVVYTELVGKKFSDGNLITEINKWANQKHFNLIFSEGKHKMKDSYKRTLKCSRKNCLYKMIFKSDATGENYQIYEKTSKKYTFHSLLFIIFFNDF